MPFFSMFSAFASHLETYVSQGGYIFLFLTTTLEGLPLIGMALPGHITIIISGFLAKIGVLNIWWVVPIALSGAILGDCIGFYIGRTYGLAFIDRLRPYFFITDQHIAKANDILARHTGKAMILGRFSPITRALLPFLLGASTHTTERKFWFFNGVGAILWVILSLSLGYVFGSGYDVAVSYFGQFTLFALIASLLIIWGYRFANTRFHVFRHYELFMLIINLFSLYVLAKTIQDAWAPHSFMANFDVYVNMLMENITLLYPAVVNVATWITHAGDTHVMLVLGLAVTGGLVFYKKWRRAAIMFLAIGSTGFLLGTLKTFFLRARPDNALLHVVNDPSFPSGHAGMAAAFFVVLAYVLAPHIKSWIRRELTIVACILIFVAIGFSRIILNVHWTSDVIAGWALGMFCASASVLVVRYVSALVTHKGEKIKNVLTSDIFGNV